MTINDVCESLQLRTINLANGEREASDVYVGDLLSHVMGHAEPESILVTVMSNINTLAVASLLDFSCVILAEGIFPDESFIQAAKEKEINVLVSSESAYRICAKLSSLFEK